MGTLNPQIAVLWQVHTSATFPNGYGGEEVDGIDLALLDTETSGCIQTLISRGGHLDIWRTSILGLCYRDLAVVTAALNGAARDYFARLETLAGLALQAVRDESKATSDQEAL
jgi:hypothetical protein